MTSSIVRITAGNKAHVVGTFLDPDGNPLAVDTIDIVNVTVRYRQLEPVLGDDVDVTEASASSSGLTVGDDDNSFQVDVLGAAGLADGTVWQFRFDCSNPEISIEPQRSGRIRWIGSKLANP